MTLTTSTQDFENLKTKPLAYRSGWILASKDLPHQHVVASRQIKEQFDQGYFDCTAKINKLKGNTNEQTH
jgi:hypothetical protein